MGKESPVNAVLTLLLDELKSSKTESRNVWQRFCGSSGPVPAVAVQHPSQQGPYPQSWGCMGMKWCVIVQNSNCTA